MTPKQVWKAIYRFHRLERQDTTNPNAAMWLPRAIIIRAITDFRNWWKP